MSIIQNTTVRLPVKLLTTTGTDPTGILPADVLNGVAQIVKGDGTKASITLNNGVNWIEIDSTQSKGLYHLVVSNAYTNVLGPMQYTVYPTATAFLTFIGVDEVLAAPVVGATLAEVNAARDSIKGGGNKDLTQIDSKLGSPAGASVSADVSTVNTSVNNLGSNITAIKTKTDNLPSDPADQSQLENAIALSIASIKGAQTLSISDIAGGMAFVANSDNLHAIKTMINGGMASPGAIWEELRNAHMTPGTFGEAIRILYQVARGHIKIDKFNNALVIYAEDGTTPLFTCPLRRNGIPASIYSDERLQG